MARNKVQFQKGLSEANFLELYGDEDLCRAQVFRWRWLDGFECPACGACKPTRAALTQIVALYTTPMAPVGQGNGTCQCKARAATTAST